MRASALQEGCPRTVPQEQRAFFVHLTGYHLPRVQSLVSQKAQQHAPRAQTCSCKAAQATRPATQQLTESTVQQEPSGLAAEKSVFWTTDGNRVVAAVEKQRDGFQLTVTIQALQALHHEAHVCWGLFRTSAARWQVPKELAPTGAAPDRATGGVCSPLTPGPHGTLSWSIRLPGRLAPVFLGFKLRVGLDYLASRHGPHFAVPIGMGVGDATTLGPSLVAAEGATCSVNFSVRSRHATAMSLCLARQAPTAPPPDGTAASQASAPGKGYLELALDPEVNRTGDVWHVCLHGLRDIGSLCYGWRAESNLGSDFVPGQVMLDPQAPLALPVPLPEGANLLARTGRRASRPEQAPALLGSLACLLDAFDFGREHRRPRHPLQRTLALEVDVPSFSVGPAAEKAVPPEHRGKYLGVLDRIAHIRAVGATAVMLSSPFLSGAGDGPFGRAPFSFFAPERAWASGSDALAPARELKELVRGLHAKGIEVWLQVEFCFTAEGTEDEGCTVSLRGLDAPIYYRQRGVLNCGHAVVRCLILDALRHWVQEYRVDGFVFVNAETLAVDRYGNILDNPPLAEAIATDPLLADVKLVAWPGDTTLLPRQGQRGFPHWGRWSERNLHSTTDLQHALGDPSNAGSSASGSTRASALATRITGSPDLFAARWGEGWPGSLATPRLPAWGLNGASLLSQSSLQDAVASLLPAPVGAAAPPGLGGLRATLAKTLLMAVMFMQGTPVLTQDAVEGPAAARFAGVLARIRRRLAPLLSPPDFDAARVLAWHGASAGSQPDWDGSALAAGVPGAAFMAYSVALEDGKAVYVALNGHEHAIQAALPAPPARRQWRRLVHTAAQAPEDALLEEWGAALQSQDEFWVNGKAGLLLVAAPLASTSSHTAA